jgi:hypothetical protein
MNRAGQSRDMKNEKHSPVEVALDDTCPPERGYQQALRLYRLAAWCISGSSDTTSVIDQRL